ncbi:hypothetical protein BU25DRAFT_489958 [Macroventuria anomochaeta]|uniref:Uncharacterized protein n=1 Tax=Macroventuria anomochaeta TaxID=301207 RepID=A0ACB6S7P6_9PLEO|nr:uncharacterized protein BU25DRAFT_489958 [Macroventuria anomochaeta]KAF2629378.1 hypothetical protein BU25DRAFT_489958 [Macroventuria anomochaeta]
MWCLVPVLKALDEAFIDNIFSGKLTLRDLPEELDIPDFKIKDMHPILTTNGLDTDICLPTLQISGTVLASSTMVPFVSYNNGKTAMLAPLNGYIISILVGGSTLRLGDFRPANAAYQPDGNGGFFANPKWAFLQNPISGPGIYPEAVDTAFRNTSDPRYSLEFWDGVVNQSLILKVAMAGQCQLLFL